QRMLSQKLNKEVLLLSFASRSPDLERLSDSVQNTLTRWENAHQLLQTGDETQEFSVNNSAEISKMFEKIDPELSEIADATKNFLYHKSSISEDSSAIAQK